MDNHHIAVVRGLPVCQILQAKRLQCVRYYNAPDLCSELRCPHMNSLRLPEFSTRATGGERPEQTAEGRGELQGCSHTGTWRTLRCVSSTPDTSGHTAVGRSQNIQILKHQCHSVFLENFI
ncbi:hypothetical protein GDO81_015436 [Engystomops pustulosus]|uniref:Uncharacterized protein n=1 Tax=Engystomops pustulosus TaxID=76066 RepID=A0AAV7AJE7_ENGPU|nr:hypothetical protein GDO81_015436 [Engystomops pustulosus]